MSAPTETEINRIVDGYNHANDAADYSTTIKCDMQLIDGENYAMRWSTEYTGPFVPNN